MDVEKFINENIDLIDSIDFDSLGNVKCIKFNPPSDLTLYGDEGPLGPTIIYKDLMNYFIDGV